MPDPTQDDSFGTLFSMGGGLVALGFVVVLAVVLVRAIQGGRQWNANNHAPVLTRRVAVVAKRADVQHSSGSNLGGMHTSGTSSTTYYVTTEDLESRDRREFRLSGREYGQLAEGDRGAVTFQGTRYRGFVRD